MSVPMSQVAVHSFSPASGAPLPAVPMNTQAQIVDAIDRARAVQPSWERRTMAERVWHVRRMRTFISSHKMDIASAISDVGGGKPVHEALSTEVLPALVMIQWLCDNAARVLPSSDDATSSQDAWHWLARLWRKPVTTHYSALGVVGIVAPSWQNPFMMPLVETAAALLAGNAVVLNLPLQMVTIGTWIDDVVGAAQLPSRYLFHHAVSPGSSVATILSLQRVPRFFLTGSVPVESMWSALESTHGAGVESLTPFALELGMRTAVVVLADATPSVLERAANAVATAGFQNAGMSCAGMPRVFVHQSVAAAFARRLCAVTSALTHGPDPSVSTPAPPHHQYRSHADDAADDDDDAAAAAKTATRKPTGVVPNIGALSSLDEMEIAQATLDAAVASGARIAAQSRAVGDCSQGFFVPATVLVDVPVDSILITGEAIAGPIVPLVAFDSEDELVELVNHHVQAVSVTLFTSTSTVGTPAFERRRKRFDASNVTVNDTAVVVAPGPPEAPFGGWRELGQRRIFGHIGLREFSRVQRVESPRLHTALLPAANMWWLAPDASATLQTTAAMIELNAPTGVRPWIAALLTLSIITLRRLSLALRAAARAAWRSRGSRTATTPAAPESGSHVAAVSASKPKAL